MVIIYNTAGDGILSWVCMLHLPVLSKIHIVEERQDTLACS